VKQEDLALALPPEPLEPPAAPTAPPAPTPFETGFLLGILVGEGHFGGDGKQPQVTLRMHVDHAALFSWIERRFPGGRLYGPYDHGGRRYYQWMARGAYLRAVVLPLLERHLSPELDAKAFARFQEMKRRYRLDPAAAEGAGGRDALRPGGS
jgi:hypothetical protein